jgi:hypothetical protein
MKKTKEGRLQGGKDMVFEDWLKMNQGADENIKQGMIDVNDTLSSAKRIAEAQFAIDDITPDIIFKIVELLLSRMPPPNAS